MSDATTAGLHVLVIEDQHDIAANIWDFLERRGYGWTTVPTARPAWRRR